MEGSQEGAVLSEGSLPPAQICRGAKAPVGRVGAQILNEQPTRELASLVRENCSSRDLDRFPVSTILNRNTYPWNCAHPLFPQQQGRRTMKVLSSGSNKQNGVRAPRSKRSRACVLPLGGVDLSAVVLRLPCGSEAVALGVRRLWARDGGGRIPALGHRFL